MKPNIIKPLKMIKTHLSFFFFFFNFLCFFSKFSFSLTDTLTSSQFLTNDQTLVSNGESFEMGLFSPSESPGKFYLGIWYKQIPDKTVVWVANRDTPLTNSSGKVQISTEPTSSILLLDQTSNLVWSSSNQTKSSVSSTDPVVIQLLDTGNLVLRRENDDVRSGNFIWQSFDHPTDTLLPGMKLGWDFRSSLDRNLTSWNSQSDPSPGGYCFDLDFHGFPEAFLTANRLRRYRSGGWNGIRFSGVPEMKQLPYMSFSFVANQDEVYYSFHVSNTSIYSRLIVSLGILQRYTWVPDSQVWTSFWYAPKDQCDNYLACGTYAVCDANASPVCTCPRGFQPKNPRAWSLHDGSGGCVRKTQLECGTDKFFHLKNVKVPESTMSWVDRGTEDARECEARCLGNCSCNAYAYANISGGNTGCVLWFGELLDMRLYTGAGQDLFVRLAAADADEGSNKGPMITGISVGCLLLFGLIIACLIWKRKKVLGVFQRKTIPQTSRKGSREKSQDFLLNEVVVSSKRDHSSEKNNDDVELPIFDFGTVVTATDNFSDQNMLGQGGFGSVYMGRLVEGNEVAVKRLSRTSRQGVEEFKNEVRLIARLQHRNLVRLLGCCIETNEKILIYEYMENRSLDSIIFDKAKGSLLSWQTRFSIVCGIARGLLYLHQDSRFRIIHRDLKASNILLDGEWTPKISDFGMARIFGGEETESSTRRVVGTYGYMSPEYAMDGIFSVKSDVFSFGVLVLEIVSGKKNRGFYHSSSEHNLLEQAWRLWKDGRGLQLLDASVDSSYSSWEVLRCIQVGLLCVQERSEDRPTMSSVVLMLGSETAAMPQPKTPGYCLGRTPFETVSSSGNQDESFTVNQVTVTSLDAR